MYKCEYCEDDGWIGDGRTPCPKCNPNGKIGEHMKWSKLKEKVIEAYLSAEAGMKDEQEMVLRWVLEEMDKLDREE